MARLGHLDLAHDVHAVGDAAEDDVLVVEEGGGDCCDEELAPVCVWAGVLWLLGSILVNGMRVGVGRDG